jgi:lipoprotein-releasing system permease protein
MILTLSIVTGFKNQVRDKVIGFGSHIQVTHAGSGRIFESQPLVNDRAMISLVQDLAGIDVVAPVSYYPGIFQSSGDTIDLKNTQGERVYRAQKEISGVMLKGIDVFTIISLTLKVISF